MIACDPCYPYSCIRLHNQLQTISRHHRKHEAIEGCINQTTQNKQTDLSLYHTFILLEMYWAIIWCKNGFLLCMCMGVCVGREASSILWSLSFSGCFDDLNPWHSMCKRATLSLHHFMTRCRKIHYDIFFLFFKLLFMPILVHLWAIWRKQQCVSKAFCKGYINYWQFCY